MSKSKFIILVGFSAIFLLVSLLIVIGVTNLNKSKSHLDNIVKSNNMKIQLVNKMHQAARERTIVVQQMFLTDNDADFEKVKQKMGFYGGRFVSSRSEFLRLNLSPTEKKYINQQAVLSQRVALLQNQIADLIEFGDAVLARELLLTKAQPLQDHVFNILTQLQDIQRNETKSSIKENSQDYKEIVTVIWLVSVAVIIISISIVFFTLRLISKNEKQQENHRQDIEYQAFYDHLTGLANRRLLNDRMQHAILQAERNEILMAVLFIDCDRFKPINDTLGHTVGDNLLISISNRLKEKVRNSDTVCRVSGDEFVILLEEIDNVSNIDRLAQSLLDVIAEPHYLEGHKVFTTVSIGITVYPIDKKDVNGLLTSADIAMYHAKQKGGNHYEYFNADMNTRSKQWLSFEQDLHEALTKNQFEVYYQPLNTIDSKRKVVGVEALLRWHHPKHGLVPPSDFISIAEDNGLIVPIGEWVLLAACKQVKKWEQLGQGKLSVSVNLSPRQFSDENLVPAIKSAIKTSGITASQLSLEITESTAMYTIDKSINILHKIKELGVKLSIDDFGTGYSSLSYLQQMPIDNLKIDRSFITNLHSSSKDKAFVQAIVTMAKTLGLKTIAEGVEIEEQFLILNDMGCDIAQGFLFSQAMPEKDIDFIQRYNEELIED